MNIYLFNAQHRDCAERAVQGSFNKLTVNGARLRVMWGRGQASQKALQDGTSGAGELVE